MKITDTLRKHLIKKGWLTDSDSNEKAGQVVAAKLKSGELTPKEFATLNKQSPDEATISGKIDERMGSMQKSIDLIASSLGIEIKKNDPPAPDTEKKSGDVKSFDLTTPDGIKSYIDSLGVPSKSSAPHQLFATSMKTGSTEHIRVKSATESYDKSRKDAIYPLRTKQGTPHALAGRPVMIEGRLMRMPSDYDKALSQAYFKIALERSSERGTIPRGLKVTDHDRDLFEFALHEGQWSGLIGGETGEEANSIAVNRRRLNDFERKALLDDTVSGGIEIAPVEFDDALVITPLLFGEFFPMVDVKTVVRGRRIKGGAIGNPDFTSGVSEGTAIQPFNTNAYITAFDTPIYNAVGSMEIGLDMEEDTPTNLGQIVLQRYGDAALTYLDRIIVIGNGTTEAEGFMNFTGATVIQSDNGVDGGPTVGDYEGLMFGVQKQFRMTKGMNNVFAGNETSYRRARSIPVGPADERRVFGMTHGDYMLLDYPYKIQNGISNNQLAFANLGYYRMYRRLGMTVRNETGGATLAQRNTRLIIIRMRWGGRMELGGAVAIINNSQN